MLESRITFDPQSGKFVAYERDGDSIRPLGLGASVDLPALIASAKVQDIDPAACEAYQKLASA